MVYKKLGELLVSQGIITNLQLSVALAAQQTSNRRLGEILVEKGFATDQMIARCLAEQFGYPMADLETIRPQANALALIRPDLALELEVLPVAVTDSEFDCVICDPVDIVASDRIAKIVKRKVNIHLAYGEALRSKIRESYGLEEKDDLTDLEYALPNRFANIRPRRSIGGVAIFDAVDHELDRKVTLAAMEAGTKEERNWRTRVQNAARVPSEFVVAVHDWFEYEKCSWCVTERLEGETLAHILRTRGARSTSQAAETVARIAQSVDSLHSRGGHIGLVCTENVFIRPQGPLLLPFAAPSEEYGAPELDEGHLPTSASDIYALGTLLWESLHGENPHYAAAVKAGVKHKWAEPQPHIGNLPAQMVEILTKAVAKSPEGRYPAALLMANSLRAYNWQALSTQASADKSEGDRQQLLSILDSGSEGVRKQGFWQKLFGKAA